jgi:hypothetical protein
LFPPNTPLEDMQIISAIFQGKVITAAFGKLIAILVYFSSLEKMFVSGSIIVEWIPTKDFEQIKLRMWHNFGEEFFGRST